MGASGSTFLVVGTSKDARQAAKVLAAAFAVVTADTMKSGAELLRRTPEICVVVLDGLETSREDLPSRCGGERGDVARLVLAEADRAAEALAEVRAGRYAAYAGKPIDRENLLLAAHQVHEIYRLRRERDVLLRKLDSLVLDSGVSSGLNSDSGRGAPNGSQAETEMLKNDAVTTAAHDIRSPMSVILGYADVLLNTDDSLSASSRGMVERIRNACGRLLELVDRILDLSVIESGAMPMTYRATRLSELIAVTVETLKGMIDSKNIALNVAVSGDDAAYAIDEQMALQVLQNVLSNAVKFSAPGGKITVTSKGSPQEVSFSVSDTGAGLSQEQQARVFDRFSRFAPDSEQGSGLGLAIAKALVERHGGKISVESEPGKGATFHFTLIPQQN